MRPTAPPLVRGAGLAAVIALGGCSHGGPVAEVSPARDAAADATVHAQPIDTGSLPRIRFARGTTSGILDDSIAAGDTRSYVLEAREGQVMLAHAIAWPVAEREHPPPEPAVRVLAAASGRELEAPETVAGAWSGRLPATGDYIVRVSASEPTTYTLAVQIPRRVQVSPEQPTAIFTGSTPSRAPIDYLVKVEAGRTLEAVLGGAPGISLHVYGLDDGVQLARLADRQRVFAGRVETTQDYVVSIVPAAERAAFDLRITLR